MDIQCKLICYDNKYHTITSVWLRSGRMNQFGSIAIDLALSGF